MLIWGVPFPLRWVFSAIDFPLSTASVVAQKFWYIVVSLYSVQCFQNALEPSSLISGLLRSVVFSIQEFPAVFLLLISSLIPWWPENILRMISILPHVLRFVLCPRSWLMSHGAWKDVRFAVVGWGARSVLLRSCGMMVVLPSSMSLWTSCC